MPLPVVVMVSLGKDFHTAAGKAFLEGNVRGFRALARNSHQPTAAGARLTESTALRSDKGLDVLYSTSARFVFHAP